MMGSIYRNAEVICWLGRGDDNPKFGRVMKYLDTASEHTSMPTELLRQELLYSWDTRTDSDTNGSTSVEMASPRARASRVSSLNRYAEKYPHRYPHEYLDHFEDGTSTDRSLKSQVLFQDIEAICTHTYWRRTWMIQEVVLGRSITIWLGGSSIDGLKFFVFCKLVLLQKLSELGVLMIDAFRILHLRQYSQNITLMLLMEFSEHSSCQDLRDKFYAMVGLASDCHENQIIPDYTKSKKQVYADIISMHITSKQSYEYRIQSIVYFSQLVQRVFSPLSASLSGDTQDMTDGSQQSFDKERLIEICGVNCGTITELCEPHLEILLGTPRACEAHESSPI
jgi:hypothetical protein